MTTTKFCRNVSRLAFINAINDFDNYPSGNFIDWDYVDAYMLLELYGNVAQPKTVTPTAEYYTWYDRAVGLYIDEFGEPRMKDADGTRLGDEL
jgi:hypothetical protein